MKLTAVTVYKRNGEQWSFTVYRRAAVREIKSIKRSGKGEYDSTGVCVRLFGRGRADISPGDKLVIGAASAPEPDSGKALTVYETADNTCIRRAHLRVSAR